MVSPNAKKTLSVAVSPAIYNIFKAKSAAENVSLSKIVEPILEKAVVEFVVHVPVESGSAVTSVQKGEGDLTPPSPNTKKEGDEDSSAKSDVHQATV
jgi:hypothetical protein